MNMGKHWKKLVVGLSIAILLTMLGCASFQEVLTPAYISEDALAYTGDDGKTFTPYTSLWDARRINKKLDYQHHVNQLKSAREMEDDSNEYKHVKDAHLTYIKQAEEFRHTLFDPDGAIGLLAPALGGLGLGFVIKRPGDKNTKEVEEEKAKAKEEGKREANGG